MRWLWFCVFVALGGAAHSATISIRSGDHDNFTRLVFNLPSTMGGTVSASDDPRQLIFTLSEQGHDFEWDTVFDRITRSRLSNLGTAPNGGLALTLGCECGVRTFLYEDRFFVLDIGPDFPKPTQQQAAGLSGVAPQTPPSVVLPNVQGRAVERAFANTLNTLLDDVMAAQTENLAQHMSLDRTDLPEQSLANEVLNQLPPPVSACRADVVTATQRWQQDGPFWDSRAALTANLVNARGTLSQRAAIELAGFYVANAMGAEALALLDRASSQDAELIKNKALVVKRAAPKDAVFAACPGLIFWNFIDAHRKGQAGTLDISAAALMTAFRGLSLELQNFFIDETLEALSQSGRMDAYDLLTAYQMRTEASDLVTDEEGNLVDRSTDRVEADSGLVQKHGDLLAQFADMQLARSASPDQRQLLEAFLIEYRGSSYLPSFQTAVVRSRMSNGAFDSAFALLVQMRRDEHPDFAPLFEDVMTDFADNASNVDFLKIALRIDAGAFTLPDPSGAAGTAFSARLAELGF